MPNFDGFDALIEIAKMNILLRYANEARTKGEPTVALAQWLDAWLRPHYSLNARIDTLRNPHVTNDTRIQDIRLGFEDQGILYSGRFSDLPGSAYARDFVADRATYSPDFADSINRMTVGLDMLLNTQLGPSTPPNQVNRQVNELFAQVRTAWGLD